MVTGVHANLECIGAEFINLVIYNIVSSFKNSVSTCISLFGCHIYIYIYHLQAYVYLEVNLYWENF